MSKFNLIFADPPFSFDDKLEMSDVKRGAESQYNGVLSIEDIKNLKVPEITADNAVLVLWVPSSLISDGLEIMSKWGFRQTQTNIWVKTKKDPFESLKKDLLKKIKDNSAEATLSTKDLLKITSDAFDEVAENFDFDNMLGFGMGRLSRACHELCLIGVKGKVYKDVKNKSQRSVHLAPNTKHSAKPEILQDRFDIIFPEYQNKIELFARRQREGWTTIGNQCLGPTFGQDIRESIEDLINKED